jgi:glycosyltransferase involved in cell wall biosynthesis
MESTVGIVAASYPPHIGGYEHVVSRMAATLSAQGRTVHVYTHVRLPESSPGVKFHTISSWTLVGGYLPIPTPRGIFQIFRALRSSRPEILVTNTRFFPVNLVAALFAALLSIPLLHIEHGAGPVRANPPLLKHIANLYDRTLGRLLVGRAAKSCGISPASCQFLLTLGAKNPVGVRVPYDLAPFLSQGPSSDNGTGEELLFVGRLIDGKGLRDFLMAVELVQEEFPGLRVTIIGSGPDENELRRLSSSLACVSFEGTMRRGRLAEWYARSSAVVYPSYSEGLGLVALEAGAAGVPLIATRSGGPESLLLTPDRAYLVQPGDVEGIANAIRRVLTHPAEARSKAATLRSAVSAERPEEGWIEDWEHLASWILA